MPASAPDPDTIAAGGEFVVEAPSVEAAVADVVERTGQQPEVLEVIRSAKGGIGGFFAKEVVQVRVRLGGDARVTPAPSPQVPPTSPSEPTERVATAQIHGVEAVLAAMTADADSREVSFGEVLRRELNDGRDPLEAAREHTGGGLFASHPRLAGSPAAATPSTSTSSTTSDAAPDATSDGVDATSRELPASSEATDATTQAVPTDEVADEVDGPVREPARAPVETEPVTDHRPTEGSTRNRAELGEQAATNAPATLPTQTPAALPAQTPGTETDHDQEPAARIVRPRRARRSHEPTEVAGPAWSMPALYRLGLPASLLDRVEVPDDAADGSWLAAVARAVAPLCGGLPEGTQALIGPDADLLGQALSLPVTPVGGNPPYGGDVALVATDRAEDLSWVDRVMGDRWRHVVVSDRPARGLVSDDVVAVSWVGSQCLPEAIGLALTCGLVLGHGMRGVGSDVVRATPLDVAIGLRDLLPRIEHRSEGRA